MSALLPPDIALTFSQVSDRFLTLKASAGTLLQNSVVLYVAIAIGLLAGCLLGTQPSANGFLGRSLAHPLQAALISFGSGFVLLVLFSLVLGVFPPRFSSSPMSLPWWAWTGGAVGTLLVTSSLYFVPRIGSLSWFGAVITGQVIAALILDQWGLMGNPRSTASPMRVLGALMLIGGVLLITRAKALEQQGDRSLPVGSHRRPIEEGGASATPSPSSQQPSEAAGQR